mgnify:CR=1 FL=1
MLLGFKQNFPWKEPTNFKEKILSGIKIHTIREDKPGRWKKGRMIQMCYRGKNYSILDEFSKGYPELQKCTGVQTIQMKWVDSKLSDQRTMSTLLIWIDGVQLPFARYPEFIVNDGFGSTEDFFRWFSMPEFTGKIIHWSDFRY